MEGHGVQLQEAEEQDDQAEHYGEQQVWQERTVRPCGPETGGYWRR